MGSKPFLLTEDATVHRVLDSLRSIIQELRSSSVSCEHRYGLSAAQLFVVQVLREEDALSLGQLALRTMTHQSSVSVVVRKLEEKGLVVKAPSAQDRRRLVLKLTAAGKRLASCAPRPVQETLIQRLQLMKKRDRATLAQWLEFLGPQESEAPPMFFEEGSGGRKRKA